MASLLLHGNMDIAAISKRLGHAKITTTLDIYSHIMKESDNESAETIADIVLRKQMA
jgi:site-specific recombinase XerD